MSVPVRREGYVPVPRQPTDHIVEAPVVLHQTSDAGWGLVLGSGAAVLGFSWTLFPLDNGGMWAGYWCSLLGTIVLMAGLGLRTSLPRLPLLATAGGSGALLILVPLLRDWGTFATTTMVIGGAVVILGAGLAGARGRD